MAKSSRASSRKTNNQRLKSKVFGPVEAQRNERLSARLLELAAAPKPEPEPEELGDGEFMSIAVDADTTAAAGKEKSTAVATAADDETAMDVDGVRNATTTTSSKSSNKKGRIEKRKKTSKMVFPKYGDKAKKKRKQ